MSNCPPFSGDASSTTAPRSLRPATRWLVILFALVVTPLAVSYGKREITLTIVNSTDLFLNVTVDRKVYLYLPPGGRINHVEENSKDGGVESFRITAFYSPGQGLTGDYSSVVDVEIGYYSDGLACDGTTGSSGSGGTSCDDGDETTLYESRTVVITSDLLQPVTDTVGQGGRP